MATAIVTSNEITDFEEEFIIGDSYDEYTGRIRVNLEDTEGASVDNLNGLLFEDADISFVMFRPNDATILEGVCEYGEDSGGDAYVLISILSTVTASAKAEYTYEGRLQFLWSQSSGEEDDVRKTFKTNPFKFVANPI